MGSARELWLELTYLRCSQDPDGFIDNGGWNFLDAEGDGSDEDGEESEEEGELMSLRRPHLSNQNVLADMLAALLHGVAPEEVQDQSLQWHA